MSERHHPAPSIQRSERIALHGWDRMISVASPIATASWAYLVFQEEEESQVPDQADLMPDPRRSCHVSLLG